MENSYMAPEDIVRIRQGCYYRAGEMWGVLARGVFTIDTYCCCYYISILRKDTFTKIWNFCFA